MKLLVGYAYKPLSATSLLKGQVAGFVGIWARAFILSYGRRQYYLKNAAQLTRRARWRNIATSKKQIIEFSELGGLSSIARLKLTPLALVCSP